MRAGWGCPQRPRCRWRIGIEQGAALVPYRLCVSVVESHRVNGKVRQEHIADLGAIDGHWLSSFFAGVEPPIVNAILSSGTGMKEWHAASVLIRAAFWRGVDEAMARLSNRLDAAAIGKITATVAERIPRPEDGEVEQVRRDRLLSRWQKNEQWYVDLIATEEEKIQDYAEWIEEARGNIGALRPAVDMAKEGVERTRVAIAQDDRQAMDRLAQQAEAVNRSIGGLLARRALGRRRLCGAGDPGSQPGPPC
jgi:hypothetical protein